ncbi:flippase-like domain-containing protein [Luteolibacter pohnpeiensis]|uniref:Flippase-like domain-containing protein n=1 Tax=Luteolibacter pohnpeiensis TaxID=454153 RepID=A0A934SB37_9BACT|nr:lysylphosphatidylglycerol synthase transmembrane domain-containing protein [Luteolibacter pohnpeiensis]MBK1882927.1 flippase-like domain-containing protein [Luteolibacter pohnpeiensis]
MKNALLFLLKLVLTAVCLWWAFSKVDWRHSVLTRPGAMDFRWLAAGAGFAGLAVVLTALRWLAFLDAQSLRISLGRAVELTMIGNLFNLVSFGGIGGDAARVILLNRDRPNHKVLITMTILMDHLMGLVALALVFFVISAVQFDALAEQSRLGKEVIRFAWVTLGGGLLMIALIFICASPPVHQRIHANGRFDRFPIMRQMPEIYDVYRRKWRHMLVGLGLSLLLLAAYFASFWCGLRAVGGTASAGTIFTAMPVIDSICSMPVSVGGVGVREKLFEVLLKDLAGVPATIAVAASLAGFACNVFWALVGALFFLKPRDRFHRHDFENAAG